MEQGEGWPQVQTGVSAFQRRVRSDHFKHRHLVFRRPISEEIGHPAAEGHKTLYFLKKPLIRPLVGVKLSQNHALLVLQRGIFGVVDLGGKGLVQQPLQERIEPILDLISPAAQRGNGVVPKNLLLGLKFLQRFFQQIVDPLGNLQDLKLVEELSFEYLLPDKALTTAPRSPGFRAMVVNVVMLCIVGLIDLMLLLRSDHGPALTAHKKTAVGEVIQLRSRIAPTAENLLDAIKGDLRHHWLMRPRDELAAKEHGTVIEGVCEEPVQGARRDLLVSRPEPRPSRPHPLLEEPVHDPIYRGRAAGIAVPRLPEDLESVRIRDDFAVFVQVAERGDKRPFPLAEHPLMQAFLRLLGEIVDVVSGE